MRVFTVLAGFAFAMPLAAVPAEQTTTQLETVIVEADEGFGDFAEWRSQIEAAIDKAKLKQRAELTAHDKKQILVLQEDMPKLREALDRMAVVIGQNPRQAMLSEIEKVELVKAYLKTQAILQNVPDELMIRCRLVHENERRNKRAACDLDYARAQQFLQKIAPKQSERDRRDVKRRFAASAERAR